MMLTIRQISEENNISQDTVRDEIARGRLPAFRIGKSIRVREEDWNAYLNRNTVAPRTVAANDNTRPKNYRRALAKLSTLVGGLPS